jgi:DinB superfamily
MSATETKTPTPVGLPAATFNRILDEGYGPGAWYGSDLRAAIADVTPASAFKRPAGGRHNIAEIALHHAFYIHSVRERLSGTTAEPFVLDGDDWFALNSNGPLGWPEVLEVVEREQAALVAAAAGDRPKGQSADERFGSVLGITCHAVYHAGQIQLLKKLHG